MANPEDNTRSGTRGDDFDPWGRRVDDPNYGIDPNTGENIYEAPKTDPSKPPKDAGDGGSKNSPVSVNVINVPQNVYELVRAAAAKYQVPADVLLAILNQESGFNANAKNTKNAQGIDRGIAQINSYWKPTDPRTGKPITDAMAYDPAFAIDFLAWHTATTYADMVANGQAANSNTWWDAGANWHRSEHDDKWTSYRSTIKAWADNGFAAGANRPQGTKGGESPHTKQIADFDEDTSFALHQVADSVYIKLLGRMPTDQEYADIHNNHWNEAQLEDFLRSQPYGSSPVDIGTAGDLRAEAHKQARAVLGRDATEGEINWLIQNKIPGTSVSAYYEQIRDKAPWAGDPDSYRAMRRRIWEIMSRDFGIAIPENQVSVAMVNAALKGKFDDTAIRNAVGATQAPGLPAGTTVADAKRVDDVAGKIWDTYFPGLPLSMDERKAMLGMTPDQMMAHIRSLPSPDNPAIQVGVYRDAKLAVADIFNQMGLVGRQPTPDDIALAAQHGGDKEAIWQSLAKRSDLLAINPGLPYHMARDQYYRERGTVEQSYADIFGKGGENVKLLQDKINDPTPGKAPEEPDYIKSIFKQGIGENEARAGFADYFKRLGRPPTIDEVNGFKSRVTTQYTDRTAEPAIQDTDLGPVAPLLGGPKKNNLFGTASN